MLLAARQFTRRHPHIRAQLPLRVRRLLVAVATAQVRHRNIFRAFNHGRALFASKTIRARDCILKVPYSVQLAPDNLALELRDLLGDEVGDVAKVAVVILLEQKKSQDSEWAPCIGRLPRRDEMHSMIFWSEDELEMIRQSSLYQETINQRSLVEKEFLAFSKIPFADFLNHDGTSESVVLSDDDKHFSEVIADRNYAQGEQVLIRYGKFSNATLLLDFGFTIPYNIHDEVQIQVNIPHHDIHRDLKLELLKRHDRPTKDDVNEAHQMLMQKLTQLAEDCDAATQSLGPVSSPATCESLSPRRQMAHDLLNGELRILKSACTWLKYYCSTLTATDCH